MTVSDKIRFLKVRIKNYPILFIYVVKVVLLIKNFN